MHVNTGKIKSNLRSKSLLSEKIQSLKDAYKGEDCYILTAGPSINDIEIKALRAVIKNKLVIAVKQTFNLLPDLVDFHLINTDNYQLYDFTTTDPIKMKVSLSSTKAKTPFYNEDLKLVIDNDIAVNRTSSLAYSMEFGNYSLTKSTDRPWGPGIMYELGIYLPELLGCKNVYIIGWDLGNKKGDNIIRFYEQKSISSQVETYFKKHNPNLYNNIILRFINKFNSYYFYFNKELVLNKPIISQNEASFIQNSSFEMYKWFSSVGINMFIISERSMLDDRIPRVEFKNIIVDEI